jgi:dUTP pyrophosphatase
MFSKKRTFLLKIVDPKVDNVLYKNHKTYHDGDSGLDLFIIDDITIEPGDTKVIDLGVKCQCISRNFCFWNLFKGKKYNYHSYYLMPRSSISKTPLMMKNSIGLIDSGYTGSLKAPFINLSSEPYTLKRGERYVQLVNSNLSSAHFKLVDELRDTTRGEGGLGSTININYYI